MLSNPEYGWCNFELGEFKGSPSYLTDVPVDILEMCIDYKKKNASICYFDEEGSDFVLIFANGEVYIIATREDSMLYKFPEITPEALIEEIILDIERNLDLWDAEFTIEENPNEIEKHKLKIIQKLEELKSLK